VSEPCARPLRRTRADHRPEADPACAGCPQLGLLRALRRARVEAGGRLSCEPGEGAILAEAVRGEARLVVLAGPDEPPPGALPGGPAARLARIDPGALLEVEGAIGRALAGRGATVVVAVAPCQLGARRAAPLAVDPARCNRCGACLGLGCPALLDPGGDAMAIDPAVCTGCGRCAPLCRGRAIGQVA
jgi:TPP-dependent indolepyruvate ferredoxin oxidoreductase alpha subunit